MEIKDNLFEINKEIEEICKHSKRHREDITLIAVSKGRDINAILKLNNNNQKNFGENRVQEITKKYNKLFDAQIKNDIRWHFIGHLQTNKINKLIPIIDTLHSLDSLHLLEAIESYYPTNNRSQKIIKEDAVIILDAYNSNPSSMKVALENFKRLKGDKKIAILGDMFELGESSKEEHHAIAHLAKQLGFDEIHLIGASFSQTDIQNTNVYETFEAFEKSFQQKKATYLIKGSRGMALERVVSLF